jgi:hypothetical protein
MAHLIRTASLTAKLSAVFAGGLLTVFAVSLTVESQRVYVACLAEHQSPTYCRLLISGR